MRKNSIKKILTIVISYLVVLSVITMFKGVCGGKNQDSWRNKSNEFEAKHKR